MEARNMQLTEAGSRTVRDESFINRLVEKWSEFLEGVNDEYTRRTMSMLYENQWKELQGRAGSLTEDTLSINAGEYTKYIFPLLRRVFPNLIANELVSVQPMSSSVGAIFYYEYKYGRNKGLVNAGQNLVQTFDSTYSSQKTEYERLGTGDAVNYGGAAGAPLSVIFQFTPVMPLDASLGISVTIEDYNPATGVVAQTAVDNGSGGFVFTPAGANTAGNLSYQTGQLNGFKFQNVPPALNHIRVTYWFDSEANTQVPDVYIDITSVPIKALSRKLRAEWSSEASDDLRAYHGVDADVELVAGVSNQVGLELDRELLEDLYQASGGITAAFDFTVPAGVSELDHIRAVLTRMSNVSFQIFKQSKYAPANWYCTSPEVAARLIQLQTHADLRPIFVSGQESPTGPFDGIVVPPSYGPMSSNFGIMRLGPLSNKFWGYQDPYFRFNKILMGLRGASYLDAGFVFAPYVPLQITPTFLDPEDQVYKKGMRTRYAKKLLRSEWYGRINITGGL